MKVLITTFGRDDAKLNVARRDIGYEKLVVITDNPEQRVIKILKNVETITGSDVEVFKIDSYDFTECFKKIEKIVARYKNDDIRFNVSGGTKILSVAAMLVCFNKGIQAYHSELKTVKLPIIRNVTFEEILKRDEKIILKHLRKRKRIDSLEKITGFPYRKLTLLLTKLKNKNLIEIDVVNGSTVVSLTPVGKLLR
jgi:uncharacterized Fe-S radical SAM superfamily protein PflX